MAKQKKEKEQEKKTTTNTASSGNAKGGRGGSFDKQQIPAVPSRSLSYPSQEDISVETTFQNLNTLKQFAKAQRGLNTYVSDQKKNASTKTSQASYAPSDAPALVHSFHNAVNAYSADDSHTEINQNWTLLLINENH